MDTLPIAGESRIETPTLTQRIKAHGTALGFDLVGISPVQSPPHGESFAEWLRRGYHGEMAYMSRTAGKRMRFKRRRLSK